jgi:copper chaperone CopZ
MTYRLALDNMSCDHCIRRVSKALAGVPGVHVGEVAVGSATVDAADDAALTAALAAVTDAGYPARATPAAERRA